MNYSEAELTRLVKFDAAKQAIAEAVSIDEVKNIHDKIESLRIYAKQSRMVAAKQLDRRFVGTDISEEYCDLARKRIAATDSPK